MARGSKARRWRQGNSDNRKKDGRARGNQHWDNEPKSKSAGGRVKREPASQRRRVTSDQGGNSGVEISHRKCNEQPDAQVEPKWRLSRDVAPEQNCQCAHGWPHDTNEDPLLPRWITSSLHLRPNT